MTNDAENGSERADPYERLARFYDLEHAGFDADIDLYDALARGTGGPVLELGVGTGRVAIELALRGYAVTGIDTSAAMLAIGKEKASAAAADVAFIQQDMRMAAVLRGRSFGLIICAIDTFLHLLTGADQLRALTSARDLLAPAGELVIDLPGPGGDWGDWEPGARPAVLDWLMDVDGRQVARYVSFQADLALQRRHMIDAYETIEASGLMRKHVIEYDLRFVFPAEAELLLRLGGMRLDARYGDYDLAPFSAESPRMILVARRDAAVRPAARHA